MKPVEIQMIDIEYYEEVRALLNDYQQRQDMIDVLNDTVPKCNAKNIQLQYINNKLMLHEDIHDREGFLAEGTLYPDADVPEIWEYLKDSLLQDAADQLGV